jgi:hypothetical protein
MQTNHFYFVKDIYFSKFPDPYLLPNKDREGDILHGRPCFYSFQDMETGLFWMVPISSKVAKYHQIYEQKMHRYHKCLNIYFANVLGYERAFLIQNMFPITIEYIDAEYVDRMEKPVLIRADQSEELSKLVRQVIILTRQGKKIIFPDVLSIESQLISPARR